MSEFPKLPGSMSQGSLRGCRRRNSNCFSPVEPVGRLRELDQRQLELGLQVAYHVVVSKDLPPVLDVPEELQHLTVKDWEALLAALHLLLQQRARSPLH